MNKNITVESKEPFHKSISFVLIILLLLFGILTAKVLNGGTAGMDTVVYEYIMGEFAPYFISLFIAFTNIGGVFGIAFVTLLLTIILVLKKENRKYSLLTFCTPIVILIINTVIKNIVQRPRPDILQLITESGYSFPSGHTMHAVALYGLIMMLASFFIKNRSLRRTIIAISSIIVLCIATSRIYLGVHYFSDILGGFLLSLIYLIIDISYHYQTFFL